MSNDDIESSLEELPDLIHTDEIKWKKSKLDREHLWGELYLKYKNEAEKRTVPEIEAMIHTNMEYYKASLSEAVSEADYHRLYERLMCQKKLCDLRKAY